VSWLGLVVVGVFALTIIALAYSWYSKDSDVGEHPIGRRDTAPPGATTPSHKSGRAEEADPSGSLDSHGTR
jgi:hypothetical protein